MRISPNIAARVLGLAAFVLVAVGDVVRAEPRVHRIESEYQSGPVEIRVLVPSEPRAMRLRVLYVLPVEARGGTRWGDAMAEIEKHGLHNRHDLIVVSPTFSAVPWYADHPTDPKLQQERHLLKVVLPFVESNYPVVEGRPGRLLLGFSKSGWGAFSLLLRNPRTFERAAAWDAPLMMPRFDQYGAGPIFGTEENFARYELRRLLPDRGDALGDDPRLFHLGYDNFRDHHRRFESLLGERSLPHVYVDGPRHEHAWGGGWLPRAVRLIAE